MSNIYHTEDGLAFQEGDTVYNYYDMELGTVGRPAFDGTWFHFTNEEGRPNILNGERVCSVELAEARGWIAKERLL
jgi:hypothetical protein